MSTTRRRRSSAELEAKAALDSIRDEQSIHELAGRYGPHPSIKGSKGVTRLTLVDHYQWSYACRCALAYIGMIHPPGPPPSPKWWGGPVPYPGEEPALVCLLEDLGVTINSPLMISSVIFSGMLKRSSDVASLLAGSAVARTPQWIVSIA